MVTNVGDVRTDATWTVSNMSLATLTAGSSPVLTAIAAGQVLTLTATIDGIPAQAQVTISSSGSLPVADSCLVRLVYARIYFHYSRPRQFQPGFALGRSLSAQTSSDGTRSFIQAFTLDGQQNWQTQTPPLNGNSVPDAFGGVLVTECQTCNQGQAYPMSIVDVDGTTGQPCGKSLARASPVLVRAAGLIRYPNAPQMAIRQDGISS